MRNGFLSKAQEKKQANQWNKKEFLLISFYIGYLINVISIYLIQLFKYLKDLFLFKPLFFPFLKKIQKIVCYIILAKSLIPFVN